MTSLIFPIVIDVSSFGIDPWLLSDPFSLAEAMFLPRAMLCGVIGHGPVSRGSELATLFGHERPATYIVGFVALQYPVDLHVEAKQRKR